MNTNTRTVRRDRPEAPARVGQRFALPAFLVSVILLLAGCDPGEVRTVDEEGSAEFLTAAAVRAPATHRGARSPQGDGVQRNHEAAASAADSVPADHGHSDHTGPDAGPPSEHSIYHAGGDWRDRFERTLSLDELAGRVQLVALVYTHCSYACPRILAMMKRIEGTLGEEYEDRVGFTLVSIDPERDDPERLRAFGENSRLDPDRWTLLSGSDEDVLTLSVLLGVKYRATDDGEFAHSNVITVLDPDGVAIHRIEGLNASVEPAIEAIRRIAP